MPGKKTKPDILDGSANPGQSPPSGIRNDSTVGAVDEIFYNLFEAKAHRNRKHKTQRFYGIVLDRDEITEEECILETSKVFYSTVDPEYLAPPDGNYVSPEKLREMLDKPGGIVEYSKAIARNLERKLTEISKENKESGKKVYRIKVYVPEIMGFLPMLTKDDVQKYQSLKKPGKKLNKKELALKENFRERLSRVTSFYGKGDDLPPILQKVQVEFNDMNNMFFGKYIGRA